MKVFKAREEEQLVATLVEVGSWDDDRSANGTSRVIVGVGGLLDAAEIIQPVVRIQRVISGREEPAAVKVPATRLRH